MSFLEKRTLLLVAIFHLFFFTGIAQSDPTGEKRVTGTYAIINASVFTSPGSSTKATVILRNGLIEAVGNNLDIPIDAQQIKGDSLFVYAGFIDVAGDAGVTSPTVAERPADFDPSSPPPTFVGITPHYEVMDYFDPSSEEISTWRKKGITMSQLLPKGDGMLPGKTAVVLHGHRSSSNILQASSSLFVKFETVRGLYPGTVLGIMSKWRELYRNAELSMEHQTLYARNKGISRPEKDRVLEAFFPVINQQAPVVFRVSSELDIRRALNLQKEKGFNLLLVGVNEGASLIPRIKEAEAQVVLSLDLPEDKASKKEIKEPGEEVKSNLDRVKAAYKDALELASAFEKEGVPFAFGTLDTKSDDFLKNIRLLVESGLTEEGALAAMTVNPAKILGMDQLAGSVEEGKLANLVITTDSLFKKDADIKYVFVDGYLFEYETNGKSKTETSEVSGIVGSWEYSAETPEGSSSGVMTISKDEDGYQGTVTYDDPEGTGKKSAEMLGIKQSGNSLEFQFNVDVQGMSISVSVSGEFSGNEYKGKLSITDIGTFPFNATKTPGSNINY